MNGDDWIIIAGIVGFFAFMCALVVAEVVTSL
jgi:hypothetical protein